MQGKTELMTFYNIPIETYENRMLLGRDCIDRMN